MNAATNDSCANALGAQTAAIQQLEGSLVQALKATKDIGASDVIVGVFIALVGALSAYLFNVLQQRATQKKERLSAHLASLMELIASFESVAVLYWVSDRASQAVDAEVTIKARHRAIERQRRTLGELLPAKGDIALHRELSKFSDDIFDLATGGDFESPIRMPSPATAMRIAHLVADIQPVLGKRRY